MRSFDVLPFGIGVVAAHFRGGDTAWGDGVDADAGGREFERECSGESEDAGFGGGVGGAVFTAAVGDVRGDIDDGAGLLLFHRHGHGAAAEESRGEIGVDDRAPVVERKVFKLVAEKTAAGDVDQQIDAPMLGEDRIECRFDVGFFGTDWRNESPD